MCRLYGFLANERTKVECTLVHAQNALLHQSRADSRGESHPDGWGVCCYLGGEPHRERRATAAHEDVWFSAIAERTYSDVVVAHIRRATIGGPSLDNTHPFVYGCWCFAHNGTLANFKDLEPQLIEEISPPLQKERHGRTDSELMFLWILSRFQESGIPLNQPSLDKERLVGTVAASLSQLDAKSAAGPSGKSSQLNILLTDGQVLLASQWNHTLYYVEREGVHDCEICGVPHIKHRQDKQYRACIAASEPISDEVWKSFPNHTILFADHNANVHLYPVA